MICILDSLASVYSTLKSIATGESTPDSFHELYSNRTNITLPIWEESTEWYEALHFRHTENSQDILSLKLFKQSIEFFDDFIERLTIYMLSLFHPWDLVSCHQVHPECEEIEQWTTWVQNIYFDKKYTIKGEGWAHLDDSGQITMRTYKGGLGA